MCKHGAARGLGRARTRPATARSPCTSVLPGNDRSACVKQTKARAQHTVLDSMHRRMHRRSVIRRASGVAARPSAAATFQGGGGAHQADAHDVAALLL